MQQEEKKLSLDEIHAELLEQLRDITAVCKKHNISYNMMCGSLLGAVRHKGFIPWDDDVDLLMTREEFQKFREIYPKECDKARLPRRQSTPHLACRVGPFFHLRVVLWQHFVLPEWAQPAAALLTP